MKWALVAVCSALALAGCATAPAPPEVQAAHFGPVLPAPSPEALANAQLIEGLRWLSRPDANNYIMAYPRDAWFAEAESTVSLSCIIQTDGRFACAAAPDKWPQFDFEQAARNLSTLLRVAPHSFSGEATAGRRFDLRIVFRLY
ncbi:MAG: hypothetical protein A4S17_12035 [Proteobacteria bacterium HN_bin10]|jgi:hypothetical protein|nr:MAG: hypothetical protein A4S17_12035 [Proteobacteria bacterium HN_bin10]